ncbi:flavodoxin domain-containing protein [Parasporobacterium paucivorans]|nr:flavodoxin domain-containing protein [Parasporobacterium paucivorans]
MKIAVIYLTKTGHSRKIANAIAGELNIHAEDISMNPGIADVDILYIVGGIYGGKSDPIMIEYIKGIDSTMVKKAVLLTSCVSKKFKQDEVREILRRKNIEVSSEEFVCQGGLGFIGRKHPNSSDLENAIAFVKGGQTP